MVIYNSAAGGEAMSNMAYPDGLTTIPAAFIQRSSGLALLAKSTDWSGYSAGDETGRLAFLGHFSAVANPDVDTVSTFSSWGAPPDLSFKPDLAAPGGNIWSTVPLAQEGYDNYSGTSMAAPHVAGAAVLIRQAHPDWTVQQVKTALSNTAELVLDPWSNDGDGDLPYSPRLMGAGRINVADALATDVIVVQQGTNSPSVALGSIENWDSSPISFNLTLQNFGSEGVYFNADGTVQTTDGYKDAMSLGDLLSVSPDEFTVPAGGMQTVTVTVDVTGISVPWHPFVEGFVVFHWGEGDELHVPYMGFLGDWNSFDVADWEFNPLIDMPGTEFYSLSAALYGNDTGATWPYNYGYGWDLGQTYNGTFNIDDIAINPEDIYAPSAENNIWVLRNIERLTVDILESDETTLVRRLDDTNWVWKNNNWRYFTSNTPAYWDSENAWWLWDGTDAADDQVADGQYILRNSATPQKVVNKLSYDAPQVVDFPVFVDTVAPHVDITSVTPNGVNQTVAWSSE